MKQTKGTKRRKPSAILSADWHIRQTIPSCRKDDFVSVQLDKLNKIAVLAKKYDIPVLMAGDLFEHWNTTPLEVWYVAKAMEGVQLFTVYGNHDLPYHSIDQAYKSGVNLLQEVGTVRVLPCGHYGQDLKGLMKCFQDTPLGGYETKLFTGELLGRSVCLWHVTVFLRGKPWWPGIKGYSSARVLEALSEVDAELVVTGHVHKRFVYKKEGRLLVNPGPLTRQSIDDEDIPGVYLWYADFNDVEFVPLTDTSSSEVMWQTMTKPASRYDERRFEAFIKQVSSGRGSLKNPVNMFWARLDELMKERQAAKPVRQVIDQLKAEVYGGSNA